MTSEVKEKSVLVIAGYGWYRSQWVKQYLGKLVLTIIEGFGFKSELCQKRSKFRMQFCLGVLNNVLHVFLLKFASISRYYVCKEACICG